MAALCIDVELKWSVDAQGLITEPVTWWVRSHGKIGYVLLDVFASSPVQF